MKRRVLIVEDDPSIARMVKDNLVHDGYEARSISDGKNAIREIRAFVPDIILLDLVLPGADGFEICRAVNQNSTRIPIIVISARGKTGDKIRALELGADDYLTKPFRFDELLARMHAVLRRTDPETEGLCLGDIQIDFHKMRATKGKAPFTLTDREFEVLRLLFNNRNRVVTRDELLRCAWGYSEIPLTRTVDQFISRLRSKIEPDPHHPRYLHTVYGDGYRLTPKG